jgi:hypothetical protein
MRTVAAETLPKLPADVASLVSQGIYSLFELQGSTASYLLVTTRPAEFYLLDQDGGITIDPSIATIQDAHIVDAISLSLRESTQVNGARYNLRPLAVGGLK